MDGTSQNRAAAAPIGYAAALLLVSVSTFAGLVMAPRWGNSAVDLIYLPAVLATAVFAGLRPSVLAALASTVAYNFFFTAPYHTLRIASPTDIVTVIVLFLVALVTSQLAAGIRKQAQIAEAHAARNSTIAGLARRLLSCTSEEEIAEVGVKELARLFDCNTVILAGKPEPRALACEPQGTRLTPADIAAAALVLVTGEATGRGIAGATPIEWQFHPVRSEVSTIAVAGLARDDGAPAVGEDGRGLLQSLLDQIALALERARLDREAREIAAIRERDRVRSTLLSSVGQDVEPKLAAIQKAVADLKRAGSADKSLVGVIGSETAKLQRYISNLVDLDPAADQHPTELGDITIDIFHRSVLRNGKAVHLTPKEYGVLAELAKHPGRVLSHAHLLKTVWGPAQQAQTEYLRVAIRALRQKLEEQPSRPRLILNEPGVGYRLAA